MAVNHDETQTAGQFATTHWSVVLLAGQAHSPASTAALERLCRAYWQPVFVFARRKGRSEADAKDLTQQFFARLLERNDFGGLHPERGKFRTFLLTAFTHFLANDYDHRTAQKRGGGQIIISLDAGLPDTPELPATALPTPGQEFDARWARNILQTALQALKAEMAAGKSLQFDALKPFLTVNTDEQNHHAAAQKLGVNPASVPVLVHRLRQRYRELVRQEVAQTVASPMELEEEMRHLFAVLNQ
jgi:RNA polymerase sigma-70 factor (ECF subfamily)